MNANLYIERTIELLTFDLCAEQVNAQTLFKETERKMMSQMYIPKCVCEREQ